MSALDELEAAELTRNQENRFIGLLANMFDQPGDVARGDWSTAIELAKRLS